MGSRRFDNFDCDEFKKSVADGYKNEVTKRIYEDRKRLDLKGNDMADMLSVAVNTYYEMEHGEYSIKNQQVMKMYENGFDINYIFTGNRSEVVYRNEDFDKFNDDEIDSLFRSLCSFVRDFRARYSSLKDIYSAKKDLIFFVINKDDDHNVYEIMRTYNSYNQEEMAIRSGYSLNKYKEVKKTSSFPRPDSKQIYAIYRGLNISPLMCLDDRQSNIAELVTLASQLDAGAQKELKKMNPTLYKVLYSES